MRVFLRGLASSRVALGVFLGIAAGEIPLLLSLRVHFQSEDAWRDIITILHVVDGIVWLSWRCALLREKDAILHLGTFYSHARISLGFPRGLRMEA